MFLLMIASTIAIAAGDVIFVDDNAPLGGDGQHWETAYKYLQDALADADSSPKPVEIRVAQGTYRPDEDTLHPSGTGDQKVTFDLINGVTIKGAYAGFGAPDPNARDIEAYETVLTGDLDSNDAPYPLWGDSRQDNSATVVNGSGTDQNAVLDGITITAGMGEVGAGMYNNSASPTLINCTFTENYINSWGAGSSGAGMHNFESSPTLINCTFSRNETLETWTYGAGMNNEDSNPTLIDCTFSDNKSSWLGGAIFNRNSNPTLTNCTFSKNRAVAGGGGLCNYMSSPIVANCRFSANQADTQGGGVYNSMSSSTFTNCIFSGNLALGYPGGGIFNFESSPKLTNCTFVGNLADKYGPVNLGNALACDNGDDPDYPPPSYVQMVNCILWDGGNEIWNNDGSTIMVAYSDVQGGYPGTANIDSDPLFVTGPQGDFYLSQAAAGQLTTSLCVDAGSAPAADIFIAGTTRTDGVNDAATVDMGYHHSAHLRPLGDLHHDGRVDFVDFAKFALYWPQTACGACGGVDLTGEGDVNFSDVKKLAGNWLTGVE